MKRTHRTAVVTTEPRLFKKVRPEEVQLNKDDEFLVHLEESGSLSKAEELFLELKASGVGLGPGDPGFDKNAALTDEQKMECLVCLLYVSTLSAIPKGLNSAADLEQRKSPQIIYCSRTHTQLEQFVQEIQKTPFWGEMWVVSLGARSSLCINSTVARLSPAAAINEKCLEMQEEKKATGKCH
jgi:hypothetical protein